MSLLPIARRLVADKALDRAAGAASSAAMEVAAPVPAGPASAPPGAAAPDAGELETAVAEAQAELARAAESKPMRHDPYQHILAGLSLTLGALPKTVRRWEEAVADVIAARHPLTPEERADLARALVEATKDGAYEGTRKEAARMIRRLDRGLAVRMGLSVGGAYVAGALTVLGTFMVLQLGPSSREAQSASAWRQLEENNPDPRPALANAEVRTDRATGRRYYSSVSLWLDPSRPPPAAPAKP